MGKTILAAIAAIVCVFLITNSISTGLTSIAEAKIEAYSLAADEAMFNSESGGGLSIGGGLSMGGSSDAGSNAGTSDGTGTGDAAGDATGDAAGDAAGNEDAGPKQPSTVPEVLNCYNNAINKAITDKAGYTKKRTTTIDSLDGGALLKIKLVVDMVYDFLGEGTTEYKNEKGKAEFLSKASLTQNDLSSIDFANNDGIYTITLGLKPGQSQANASGSSDTTPLARSGLFVGKGDKKAFDYKSSENIYTAINGVAKAESAKETVKNATIVAKIDSTTGQITSLEVKWNWDVSLTNVSYSVANVKQAKGTATSTVVYSDFQW